MTDPYVAKNREKIKAQRRARYAKDSSKTLADNKAWRKRNADSIKRRRRVRVYGTDGEALWAAQKGKCAICAAAMHRGHRHPLAAHVDHNHATGKVRGWLCHMGNTGVGLFGDDAARLRAAAAYLDRND